ncbi:MAG: hypothetical protein AUI54_03480 [Acidobacteria bacterium 13_1_40CM_2_56_5]|nr:MAG: hypothetical protein AUI54_03480 [Acidobacteria bacterium 13_1_40CM_2_56_5]
MTRPTLGLLLLLLQAPSFVVQQPQDQRASIEGVVLRIGTDEPIAGAKLKLMSVASASDAAPSPSQPMAVAILNPMLPSTQTDRNGRFVFKDVDAGSYRISAARNGYAKLEYGQRAIRGAGTVISVVKGQAIKDIVFRLTPAGSVSGNVRDVSAEPLTGFQVLLLRSAYNPTGRRSFQAVGSARTDDHGAYRFYWVTPGRYYLSAGRGLRENSGFANPNEVDAKPYPTTYYPGTPDPAEAQAVEILPGEERNAIEFVLPQQQMYRIRGKVVDSTTGKPPSNTEIRMTPRRSIGPLSGTTNNVNYNPVNGTFEFRGVAPGSYQIFATTQPELDAAIGPNAAPRTVAELLDVLIFSRPTAQAAVEVSASDVENLILTLSPGISIPGRLRVDGQELAAIGGFENIHIMLESAGAGEHMQLPRPMAPDGTFSLDNVPAGEYRLRVNYPQPTIYVRAAFLNSVDVLHQPLVVSNTPPGTLEITLSSKAGQVDGNVLNEQSQPIAGIQAVLIPDRFRDRFGGYKTAVTDPKGHFVFRSIAPGEYKIFAWEAIEDFAYFDPDFLRSYEDRGKLVSISESSRQTVDVNIITAR